MLRFARTLRHTLALPRPAHAPSACAALQLLPPLRQPQRRCQSTTVAAAAAAAAPALLAPPATAAAATAAAAAASLPASAAGLVTAAGASAPDLTLLGPSLLDAGFPGYEPHLYLQYALMQGVSGLHSAVGLEWWGAVVAASLGLRVGTFFLCFVRTTRMGAWMQHHAEALSSYSDRLAVQRAAGDSAAAAATTREYFAFMAEKRINAVRDVFVPALAQVVLFGSFFTGLRKLAFEAHLVPGLGGSQAVAGTWLLALHLPDPTMALPLASALLSSAAIVANPNVAGLPQAELSPGGMKLIFVSLTSLFSLFSLNFPGSVQLYLAVTSGTMLVQQGLLRVPAVTRALGFPADWPLPAEVVAARAAKRTAEGKDGDNLMVGALKGFAPAFRVVSDVAAGKLRLRPKHDYIGFLGLREPGAAPPPTGAPPPQGKQ